MKVAIIGSRSLVVADLEKYLPMDIQQIISGGAIGVDSSARTYALKNNIPLIEFIPDYKRYGKKAPLVRNVLIVKEADLVLAFWDGRSTGTIHTLKKCKEMGVPYRLWMKRNP